MFLHDAISLMSSVYSIMCSLIQGCFSTYSIYFWIFMGKHDKTLSDIVANVSLHVLMNCFHGKAMYKDT